VLLRRQLLRLGVFTLLVKELALSPDEPRSGDEVRALLARHLPAEPAGPLFRTLVNWGRRAQVFDYHAPTDEISLFAGDAVDDTAT
jgi:hypothetical protein